MQNNSNKIINIARKGFADSLALALYKTDALLDCLCSRGKEHSLPNVLAELYIRYCFAPSPDLRLKLLDLLPDGVGETLLSVVNRFPYSEPPFATDLDYGNARKIKEAIAARWNHFANADGAFPVCSENDAFLLPFYLYVHQKNTPWVIDWNGNEIAEWNEAVEKLHIPYQVKISISGNVKLEGHSLQLPVYLASLVKSNLFLPFDPYRFIATGAIENDQLRPVLFSTKYDVLRNKNTNALFVCPKPSEDCVIADINTGIMPVGFSLRDTRNFCSEFIVKHRLLKNEPENKSFSGRQYELSKIHSLLNPYSKQEKKIPLLLGASGIGKTALANQYAQIMTSCEYHAYALLNGDSSYLPDLFNTFYSNPINQERFGFTIPDTLTTPKDKFESFLHQLKRRGDRILFILDNLSPEMQLNEDIKNFFPDYAESGIDIIATANVCQFCVNDDDIVCTLKIDGLSVPDGISLLRNKREIESAEERKAAEEIVKFLGGNAWALAVVGETLKQSPEKFDDDYREKLKELKLLPLEALTPNSGMVRISHGKEIDPVKLLQPVLDRLDSETLEIAQAAACCAPEYIYPTWLWEFYEAQHNVKFENEKQWRRKNIIAKLKQCNILTEHDGLFHMHRLTRWVIKEIYKKNLLHTKNLLTEIVKNKDIDLLSAHETIAAGHMLIEALSVNKNVLDLLTENNNNILILLIRHSQYLLACKLIDLYMALINEVDFIDTEKKEYYSARLLKQRVDINIVNQNFTQALHDSEIICSSQKNISSSDYCECLCQRANIYIWLKNFDKAANILQKAYNIIISCQLIDTKVHVAYLERSAILNNWLERYKYAEDDLKQAIAIKEKLVASEFSIVYTLHLLGDCYRYQNKFTESLSFYDRCELFYNEKLEKLNLSTARLYFNKASTLLGCNNIQSAILYWEKSKKIHEELLGEQHPFTRNDYLKLYKAYIVAGDSEKASWYKSKITIYKSWLSERRKAIALSRQLNNHEEAEKKLQKILDKQISFYDFGSDEISFTAFELAEVQIAQGKYQEAMSNLNYGYDILKKHSCQTSSWDSWYFAYMSKVYRGLKDSQKQLLYSEKAILAEQTRIPRDHEKLAIAYNDLAVAYRESGLFLQAEEYHKKALAEYPDKDKYLTPETAAFKTAYARTLLELEHFREALDMAQEVLAFRLATLQPYHENIAINYYVIGQILFKQGNFDKAITSLNSALNVTTMPEYQGRQITSEVIQELLDKIRSCQK